MTDKVRKRSDIVSVAKAANVSASTVSRYFNHPELVTLVTRRKIETAVRRQGYIRNRAAQTIHGIRSGTIGVIIPTLDHAIFAEVVQAFSDTVAAHGFTILLASHGYDQQREYAILRKLLEHRVDGIVLTGAGPRRGGFSADRPARHTIRLDVELRGRCALSKHWIGQ